MDGFTRRWDGLFCLAGGLGSLVGGWVLSGRSLLWVWGGLARTWVLGVGVGLI